MTCLSFQNRGILYPLDMLRRELLPLSRQSQPDAVISEGNKENTYPFCEQQTW